MKPRLFIMVVLLPALSACSGTPSSDSSAGDASARKSTENSVEAAIAGQLPSVPYLAVEPPVIAVDTRAAGAGTARLAYSSIVVRVDNDVATTRVTDVFVNDLDTEVSLTYRFPLPADAAITSLADYRGGRRIEATVEAEEDAREEFEEAVAAGDRAVLGEQSGRSFSMELSPIDANASRRVELEYVQTLTPMGPERDFVFPADHSNSQSPRLLDVMVFVRGSEPLLRLVTPNHPDAQIERQGAMARVALHRSGAPLGEDLVVRWTERAEPTHLSARAARLNGDTGYVEARFSFNHDPFEAETEPVDVILAIDGSLSMAGEAMARSREIARRTVEELRDSDRVAIVVFDDAVRSWEGFLPLGTARERALREIAELRPSGQTHLTAAIDRVAELARESEAPVLVLASDGQPTIGDDLDAIGGVSDADDFEHVTAIMALFNYPGRQAAVESLFANVTVRYVPDGDAGNEAVDQIVELATAPVIEDLEVEVVGATEGAVYGLGATRLVRGDRVRILAKADGLVTVRVRGKLHGRLIEHETSIEPPEAATNDRTLAVEWARAAIADLERQYRAEDDSTVRGELRRRTIDLGTEHRLASMFTSFVSRDTLGPDRIMPGDPEIRIHAPRSAESVYAVLPWGEIVQCEYDEDEQLWFGRFLIPRETSDDLYRMRVFVRQQGETELRGTLMFRVDSRPPEFDIEADLIAGLLRVVATPVADVFDTSAGSVRMDLVDVRSLTVRVGDDVHSLMRTEDERWEVTVPVLAGAAAEGLELSLVATDYARNTRSLTHTVESP